MLYKNILRTLFIMLFCGFCLQKADARISVFVNGNAINTNGINIQYFVDTSFNRNFQQFLQIKNQLQPLPAANLKMSYRGGMFWLTIDLSTLPKNAVLDYLMLHNPHINFLGAWLLRGDSLLHAFTMTGDHVAFNSRNVKHQQFVYHLNQNAKNATLVLLVDKRDEQLHLPLNFFTADNFITYNRENYLLTGLLIGISIFILLFILFLYFNIREKLYVYYLLYVLMVALYVFTDVGLSFMVFYPNAPSLADFARPFSLSQAPIYYILFSRSLLNVKHHYPRLHRFTNWFIVLFILLFITGFILVPDSGPMRTFWLLLMQGIMVAAIVPVFIFSILSYRAKIKYAGYVLFASLLFTVFTQIYMQYLTGNVSDSLLTRHAINIGYTVEIALLAFALSIRFKNYKTEAESLLRKLNEQQENIFKNISEYQEIEMRRISGWLHDAIGAGLSSVKYNLEALTNNGAKHNNILQQTISDVSVLTDDVRNMSHNFSPVLLEAKGLLKGLEDLIAQYNRTGKIQIFLEPIGSLHTSSFQNEILVYRIVQELLQNTIKHAQATEMMIQIILEPELISVFVEDNGRGFDTAIMKDGLGYAQIKGLVTFVNGRFELNSQPNKGCSVSIEFPVLPNDYTNKGFTGGRSPYVFGRG